MTVTRSPESELSTTTPSGATGANSAVHYWAVGAFENPTSKTAPFADDDRRLDNTERSERTRRNKGGLRCRTGMGNLCRQSVTVSTEKEIASMR
jgi:hypothetical protein